MATTEIRTSQDLILINGVGFARHSTFEIKAIVDPAKIDSYVVPYLLSVAVSIKKQLGDQSVNITVRKDDSVLIPALREDRIAYQTELLTPAD